MIWENRLKYKKTPHIITCSPNGPLELLVLAVRPSKVPIAYFLAHFVSLCRASDSVLLWRTVKFANALNFNIEITRLPFCKKNTCMSGLGPKYYCNAIRLLRWYIVLQHEMQLLSTWFRSALPPWMTYSLAVSIPMQCKGLPNPSKHRNIRVEVKGKMEMKKSAKSNHPSMVSRGSQPLHCKLLLQDFEEFR